jgi:hypothetical protein
MADDVDRLFQAPLSEFTSKRNELLKAATGADKTAIRALQKPTVPAWAVNQLFWKRRKVFDRLLEAARKLRVEHGRQLSGKAAEVDVAEARHRDALKAATDEIRALLEASGEQATPATMVAVAETLQGLPGRDDYGRLTRPLKPQGFEALTGLVGKSGATITRLSTPKAKPASTATGKREAQTRVRETAAAERALRRAEVEERAARTEASRAEMVLARLQRERKELQERIDAITSRRDQASVDLDERRRAADRALSERERLEEKLKGLRRSSHED